MFLNYKVILMIKRGITFRNCVYQYNFIAKTIKTYIIAFYN